MDYEPTNRQRRQANRGPRPSRPRRRRLPHATAREEAWRWAYLRAAWLGRWAFEFGAKEVADDLRARLRDVRRALASMVRDGTISLAEDGRMPDGPFAPVRRPGGEQLGPPRDYKWQEGVKPPPNLRIRFE